MSLYAKALAALLGGVSIWGVTASEDGIDAAEWFGLLAVLGTAVAVFAVPNTVDDPEARDDGAGELRLIGCILLALVLFFVVLPALF